MLIAIINNYNSSVSCELHGFQMLLIFRHRPNAWACDLESKHYSVGCYDGTAVVHLFRQQQQPTERINAKNITKIRQKLVLIAMSLKGYAIYAFLNSNTTSRFAICGLERLV